MYAAAATAGGDDADAAGSGLVGGFDRDRRRSDRNTLEQTGRGNSDNRGVRAGIAHLGGICRDA